MVDHPSPRSSLPGLSSCDVSDAMQTLGYKNVYVSTPKLVGPLPLTPFPGKSYLATTLPIHDPPSILCGPAFTVQLTHASDPSTPKYPGNFIDECPSNHIMIIATPDGITHAVFGGLAALRVSHLGCLAVVTNGCVRDLPELRMLGLPVFARSTSIQSARQRTHAVAVNIPVVIDGVTIHPEDLVYADEQGVAIVPKSLHGHMLSICEKQLEVEQACKEALASGMSLAETFSKYR